MHPLALAAVIVLVVNDWLLKPRFAGSFVTGKLSDLAGLTFAPVLLSAAIGLALHVAAGLGARVDPSLSRRRLVACCAATAVGFALTKVCPPFAALVARAIGHHAQFYPDWTDLLCVPCVFLALWIGRDELRRIPLGRPAAVHRLHRPAHAALADVRWSGRDTHAIAGAIDRWDVAQIDAELSSQPAGTA
jgi:hypothetical protein